MTASAANSAYGGPDDAVVFDQLEVWPDEIRIGDIFGGFVVTAVAKADHYRADAVRLTIFTDPDSLEEGVKPQEWGRVVLMTDRKIGHKVPVDRPVR
jgi:hypothetical protein